MDAPGGAAELVAPLPSCLVLRQAVGGATTALCDSRSSRSRRRPPAARRRAPSTGSPPRPRPSSTTPRRVARSPPSWRRGDLAPRRDALPRAPSARRRPRAPSRTCAAPARARADAALVEVTLGDFLPSDPLAVAPPRGGSAPPVGAPIYELPAVVARRADGDHIGRPRNINGIFLSSRGPKPPPASRKGRGARDGAGRPCPGGPGGRWR